MLGVQSFPKSQGEEETAAGESRAEAAGTKKKSENLVLPCLGHVSIMFQQQRVFLLACVQGNCVWKMKAVWVTQLGCG